MLLIKVGQGNQMVSSSYQSIYNVLLDAEVVDTHDHLRFAEDLGRPMTFAKLLLHTYVTKSIRPADGSPNGIQQAPIYLEDNYETLEAVARRARYTSSYRWLMRGLADLYNLPIADLTPETYRTLTEQLPERYNDPTWTSTVLDRSHIKAVIWDPFWKPGTWIGPDPRLIPSLRIDSSVVAFHPDAADYERCNIVSDWAEALDLSVSRLQDLEDLIYRVVKLNLQAGMRSIKLALAYHRTLRAWPTTRADAIAVFGTPPDRITPENRLTFGDYIIHFYMEIARQHDLVVQVHTGLARLPDSSPMLMLPLIEAYPGLTFDLFHGGYPWIHDVGAIAQNYPNVRLNLTWLPQLSTEAAVSALKEWLQVTPQADRITWGADCHTVEEMYGALLAARHVVARAMAELVDDGYLSMDEGVTAGRSVLGQGGEAIYRTSRADLEEQQPE
jgi:hypothetical protein